MKGYVVVLTTVPDADTGERIARELVSSGLAACVSMIRDVKSIYMWKGALETSTEYLLLLKTTINNVPALIKKVKELHPYEVPEIIVLPIICGDEAYLNWIDEVCSG